MTNWLTIPVLAQRDPRWASKLMGKSPDSTIGRYGCLITCNSMMAGTTPLDMNSRMMSLGGYQTGNCPACAATFDVQKFAVDAPAIIEVTNSYPFAPFPKAAVARLVEHLKAGNPAICEVDSQLGTPGQQAHYVLAVSAFGAGSLAQVVINDPWFEDQTTIAPRYGGDLGRALVRAILYGGA